MLLCTQCSDSKWEVSQEASGIHLKCSAVTVTRDPATGDEYGFSTCGNTMILPHYMAVVPTG